MQGIVKFMMQKIFVEWKVSQQTPYGKFARGSVAEVPKDDAIIWIKRGICSIPEMVEVVYVGKLPFYKYKARGCKVRYVLNQNVPRLLPLKDVRYLYRFPGEFLFNKQIPQNKIKNKNILEKSERMSVLIKYNGNFGDVLRMTGIIRTLYENNYKVTVKVKQGMESLFENNPYVSTKKLSTSEEAQQKVIQLGDIQVHDKEKANILRVNTWLRDLGFEDSPFRKPEYYITKEEKQWAKEYIKRDGRLVIGIATTASVPGKTWDKFESLVKRLYKHKVIILDEKSILSAFIKQDYRFNLRQLGAVIDECDVIITGDSLCLHIAGALDKPCIVLCGNTNGNILCQNYANCTVLQGKCINRKDPCWYSMECKKDYHKEIMPCLKSIKTRDVITALNEIL